MSSIVIVDTDTDYSYTLDPYENSHRAEAHLDEFLKLYSEALCSESDDVCMFDVLHPFMELELEAAIEHVVAMYKHMELAHDQVMHENMMAKRRSAKEAESCEA